MRVRIILTVFWAFSVMLAAGDAQILRIGPAHKQRPVWTMELIKVKAGELGATLDYLDEHWSRVREEAKREGAVLSYHRIADQGGADTDQTIVLLTEYKDQVTYREREKLFSSIAKSQNLPLVWSLRGNPGMMLDQHADLFESLSTSVYNDYTDPGENVRIVRFQAVY
ncbi:MAG TPA: hypothetical protein VF749_15000 [Candidatus Acidoferrum sp.]